MNPLLPNLDILPPRALGVDLEPVRPCCLRCAKRQSDTLGLQCTTHVGNACVELYGRQVKKGLVPSAPHHAERRKTTGSLNKTLAGLPAIRTYYKDEDVTEEYTSDEEDENFDDDDDDANAPAPPDPDDNKDDYQDVSGGVEGGSPVRHIEDPYEESAVALSDEGEFSDQAAAAVASVDTPPAQRARLTQGRHAVPALITPSPRARPVSTLGHHVIISAIPSSRTCWVTSASRAVVALSSQAALTSCTCRTNAGRPQATPTPSHKCPRRELQYDDDDDSDDDEFVPAKLTHTTKLITLFADPGPLSGVAS
ncbi:hypothetical protein B7463_g2101, partial [Scytalidium lignicola]